jgi:hypothetical protein
VDVTEVGPLSNIGWWVADAWYQAANWRPAFRPAVVGWRRVGETLRTLAMIRMVWREGPEPAVERARLMAGGGSLTGRTMTQALDKIPTLFEEDDGERCLAECAEPWPGTVFVYVVHLVQPGPGSVGGLAGPPADTDFVLPLTVLLATDSAGTPLGCRLTSEATSAGQAEAALRLGLACGSGDVIIVGGTTLDSRAVRQLAKAHGAGWLVEDDRALGVRATGQLLEQKDTWDWDRDRGATWTTAPRGSRTGEQVVAHWSVDAAASDVLDDSWRMRGLSGLRFFVTSETFLDPTEVITHATRLDRLRRWFAAPRLDLGGQPRIRWTAKRVEAHCAVSLFSLLTELTLARATGLKAPALISTLREMNVVELGRGNYLVLRPSGWGRLVNATGVPLDVTWPSVTQLRGWRRRLLRAAAAAHAIPSRVAG